MSQLDFNALLVRAVAVPTQALSLPETEGKPFWFYSQEASPFFVARIANLTWDEEESEEIDAYEFDVIVRGVFGNRTEGSPGESEERLYTSLPLILEAYLSRDLLQSALYPAPLDWLENAEVQPTPGMIVVDAAGIGGVGQQLAVDITIRCTARLDNTQTYE